MKATTVTEGTVYWITGLSGAGKTSIGRQLHGHLVQSKPTVIFLDGDVLRETFGNDLCNSRADRLKSAMRNSRLCKLLADQGMDVVCATISLFHSCHHWNRENIKNYVEIFVDAPLSVLQQRDRKGIYAASGGDQNVVGVHIAEERPQSPHITLTNDGSRDLEEVANALISQVDQLKPSH